MKRKIKINETSNEVVNIPISDNSPYLQILNYLQELFPNKLSFTIKEAAEILSISCDFLRKQIKAGTVKSIKFGDKYLINIYEINRLLIKGI